MFVLNPARLSCLVMFYWHSLYSPEPPSKGTGEEVEKLPDLQVQKLEHLNKDRPKRTKTRAPTRPVAPGKISSPNLPCEVLYRSEMVYQTNLMYHKMPAILDVI